MENTYISGDYWNSEDYATWVKLAERDYHNAPRPIFNYSDIIKSQHYPNNSNYWNNTGIYEFGKSD